MQTIKSVLVKHKVEEHARFVFLFVPVNNVSYFTAANLCSLFVLKRQGLARQVFKKNCINSTFSNATKDSDGPLSATTSFFHIKWFCNGIADALGVIKELQQVIILFCVPGLALDSDSFWNIIAVVDLTKEKPTFGGILFTTTSESASRCYAFFPLFVISMSLNIVGKHGGCHQGNYSELHLRK